MFKIIYDIVILKIAIYTFQIIHYKEKKFKNKLLINISIKYAFILILNI